MPQIIGLTGGIATGKSSVSNKWRAKGATIIDADKIARQVVRPGQPAYKLIRNHFGPTILHPDGTLNRAALGRLIFSDAVQRQALNRRIHPFIMLAMFTQMFVAIVARWRKVIVLDAPLLFESGSLVPFCSKIVVVYAPIDVQRQRLMKRDAGNGFDEEQARNRINSQMPIEKKCERADYVIDNGGSKQKLEENALDVWYKLQPSPVGEVAFRAVVCGCVFKLITFIFGVIRR